MITNIYGQGFSGLVDGIAGDQAKWVPSSGFALAVSGRSFSWFRQGLGENMLPVGKRRIAPSVVERFSLILL